ncbi:hypothetical protein NL108_005913 [Boleophthalmus pectinirostris]|nr:hypothetical protein NL108_005913 [Boleophthalmus pectinirostris]
MRTHPLTVHAACPGHSQKDSLLQLLSFLSTETSRGPVWLWLLMLSVLCGSAWADDKPEIQYLRPCIENISESIKKSDATLYTPSKKDIMRFQNCMMSFLHCYMLELAMVLNEESLEGDNVNCIFSFIENENLKAHTGDCPKCEETALQNSTIFLNNLITLLEIIQSKDMEKNV